MYTEKLLAYKIEIKSLYYAKGRHYLWFNLPDNIQKELTSGDLDV